MNLFTVVIFKNDNLRRTARLKPLCAQSYDVTYKSIMNKRNYETFIKLCDEQKTLV